MKTRFALAVLVAVLGLPLLGCGPPPPVKSSAKRAMSQVQRSARRSASRNIRTSYSRDDERDKGDARDERDAEALGEGEGDDQDLELQPADSAPLDDFDLPTAVR